MLRLDSGMGGRMWVAGSQPRAGEPVGEWGVSGGVIGENGDQGSDQVETWAWACISNGLGGAWHGIGKAGGWAGMHSCDRCIKCHKRVGLLF